MLRLLAVWFLALGLAGCAHTAGGIDIWEAVEQGDTEAIKTFADSGGDLDVLAWDGTTPLWYALTENKRDSYEALLENGADPDIIMRGKRVVTHWAAMRADDASWSQLALENGADPDLVNTGSGRPSEGPPLKAAISEGAIENVTLLVQYGADIDKKDRFGCDPLADACAQNHFEIVLYLLEQGADYENSQSSGIPFIVDVGFKCSRIDKLRLEEDRRALSDVCQWLEAHGVDLEE